ncbi:dephospho-CoA kinase [Erythrobacteraceae bacterium CFH 75059]|uniref:dephospho-CoA kinase n=1 Tax=Qipengyuania thermophila TaxID=2509361 RepID=UPI00101F790D|nr:dephospho-CoA kinase [Qipengyuania thermophila]TCD06686.1 dephospho-CoA kinase [Erythrobacteraceae bacterium CFH 75059]
MTRPLVLGLTGSVGMGKSTVAQMFREEGVPVFDADAVVHRFQGPGGALVAAIETAFPGSTGREGVDRASLRDRVLMDDAARRTLEAIVHPAVGAERQLFLLEHGGCPLVVFDIPLLFETKGDALVDRVLVVSAPPEVQRRRVLARPGMTPEAFARILALQLPDADKRARADHVIDTGVPLAETRAAVQKLIRTLHPG